MNKLVNILLVLTLVFWLSSCAWFGTKNPHTEGLIIPPEIIETTSPVEDDDTTLIITPSTWFATEDIRG